MEPNTNDWFERTDRERAAWEAKAQATQESTDMSGLQHESYQAALLDETEEVPF